MPVNSANWNWNRNRCFGLSDFLESDASECLGMPRKALSSMILAQFGSILKESIFALEVLSDCWLSVIVSERHYKRCVSWTMCIAVCIAKGRSASLLLIRYRTVLLLKLDVFLFYSKFFSILSNPNDSLIKPSARSPVQWNRFQCRRQAQSLRSRVWDSKFHSQS